MNYLLVILLSLQISLVFSQINLKDANAKHLVTLTENSLNDNSNNVLFTIEGQIVFKGNSNNKNDIVLTLNVRKNKVLLNENVSTIPKWIIQKNEIFWRKNREDFLIINIKKQDGFTSFYNARNDSLIAFLDGEEATELQVSLIFFYLWRNLELEDEFSKKINLNSFDENMPEGIVGFMKPVFGDPLNVWLWNGEVLYHAYDNDPFYVWAYDGSTLKPKWNSRIETEWSWDGEEIKPYWGGHPRNNWRWEGNILRQVFENNYKNEFEIVDNKARKRFGAFGEIEWEIHGEMPLPLISIILLNIVQRR